MALPDHLAEELQRTLESFGAANDPAVVPSAAGKALEAWLALRLANAARLSGLYRVTLRSGNGNRLPRGKPFIFPTDQDGIRARSTSGPGWILIEPLADLSDESSSLVGYELHIGLQWVGRCGATHECDISLIPKELAEQLRHAGGGHPRGLPIAAFECKDRGKSAPTDEMRQTVARMFDLAFVTKPYPGYACRMFEPVTMLRWGRYRSTYRAFFGSGNFDVIRTKGFLKGAHRLGVHYHVGLFGHIYQNATTIVRVEDRFVNLLRRIKTV